MSSVTLIIRCANQAIEDQKIDAKSDWTVRQLKIYLCDVHPAKPAPERQRIVFAGQLLSDEARLADYFQRYNSTVEGSTLGKNPESYVLHLVYTSSVEDSVAAAERRANQQTSLRRRLPTASATVNHEPRQQNSPTPVASNLTYSLSPWSWTAGQQPQVGAPGEITNDWMQQHHQMYTAMNSMMVQWYSQYMQAVYACSPGFYPVSPVQPPNAVATSTVQQQGDTVVPQEAPRAQAPPQQVMNAQGGLAPADDEDDPRNRDWLDYVYMACRASLLLMILYFYSSIERFVFVVLCCALMYGLQAGWFGRRGQQQQHEQQRRQAAVGAPAQNDPREVIGDGERPVAVGAEQRERADPNRQTSEQYPLREVPMTAWHVFWTTCWTFISSFFASLVPERPPPLNL